MTACWSMFQSITLPVSIEKQSDFGEINQPWLETFAIWRKLVPDTNDKSVRKTAPRTCEGCHEWCNLERNIAEYKERDTPSRKASAYRPWFRSQPKCLLDPDLQSSPRKQKSFHCGLSNKNTNHCIENLSRGFQAERFLLICVGPKNFGFPVYDIVFCHSTTNINIANLFYLTILFLHFRPPEQSEISSHTSACAHYEKEKRNIPLWYHMVGVGKTKIIS